MKTVTYDETRFVLVPREMSLSPEAIRHITEMCGGQDDDGGSCWLEGVLWVGTTFDDDGTETWGLNIACLDILEEGSLPLVEFPNTAAPSEGDSD